MLRPNLLILMRGLPGSGKSTKAKMLAEAAQSLGLSVGIYSTDDFFVQDGRYVFNPDKIVEAHGWNRERVANAMRDGQNVVIVDNTNTTLWECEHYLKLADTACYEVEFQEPDSSWWLENRHLLGSPTILKTKAFQEQYADLLVSKNTHGVPKAGILKMIQRWEIFETT